MSLHPPRILDGYAGPGGWSVALADLGWPDLGVDIDGDAVATRRAAGHHTELADLSRLPVDHFGDVAAVIMSPPCPLWSTAGKRWARPAAGILAAALSAAIGGAQDIYAAARSEVASLLEPVVAEQRPDLDAAPALDLGIPTNTRAAAEALAHEAVQMLEPARWIAAHRPDWVALEQVPAVAPLWDALTAGLRHLGYGVATGVVNACDYGAPQRRRRAVLLAAIGRLPTLPAPTHGPGRAYPWVSIADAIGCPPDAVLGFPRRDDGRGSPDGYRTRDWAPASGPAATLTEKARSWTLRLPDGSGRLLTLSEALTLQTFPAGYPVAGARRSAFHQVGNAVPPILARALLSEAIAAAASSPTARYHWTPDTNPG